MRKVLLTAALVTVTVLLQEPAADPPPRGIQAVMNVLDKNINLYQDAVTPPSFSGAKIGGDNPPTVYLAFTYPNEPIPGAPGTFRDRVIVEVWNSGTQALLFTLKYEGPVVAPVNGVTTYTLATVGNPNVTVTATVRPPTAK